MKIAVDIGLIPYPLIVSGLVSPDDIIAESPFRPIPVIPNSHAGTNPFVPPAVFRDDIVHDPPPTVGRPGRHATVAVVMDDIIREIHRRRPGRHHPPAEIIMHKVVSCNHRRTPE